MNTALLKKGKERKLNNSLKNSGGFLDHRSSHHIEKGSLDSFLHTCLDLIGLMFCFVPLYSAGLFLYLVFRYASCLPALGGVCCLLACNRSGWPERCPANPPLIAALQFLLTRNMSVSRSPLTTHTSFCGFGFNHYPHKGIWNTISTSEDGSSVFEKAEGDSEEHKGKTASNTATSVHVVKAWVSLEGTARE